MGYLIAKYTLLFLLAALVGWLAGRWWTRRSFVDVTESFERFESLDGWTKGVDSKLDSLAGDITPLRGDLRSGFEGIPQPQKVNLGGVEQRLSSVNERLAQMDGAFDLQPLLDRINAVDERVSAIDVPPAPDLQPLQARLDSVAKIASVDLRPLETRLQALSDDVADIKSGAARGDAIDERFAGLQGALSTLGADTSGEDLRAEVQGLKTALHGIEMPVTDLGGVESRLEAIEARLSRDEGAAENQAAVNALAAATGRIDDLEQSLRNMPAPRADLGDLDARLNSLTAAVTGNSGDVDLTPINTRLDALQRKVEAIEIPPAVQPEKVDLSGLTARLGAIETKLQGAASGGDLRADLNRLQSTLTTQFSAGQKPTDLAPLESRLASLEALLRERPAPASAVDLSPLEQRLRELQVRITALNSTQTTDLQPVDDRLTAIEAALKALAERAPQPSAPPPERSAGPKLLSSPTRGPKDDLKRISGVGPKLERLLNRNGVFYFWQIASWSPADIQIMDDRLEVFKGRIERDDWVEQAGSLAQETGSAVEA
ncbi:MAG: hypothetical protein AAF515_16845 [Pseudomonadota bacterium]